MQKALKPKRVPRAALQYVYATAFDAVAIDRYGEGAGDLRGEDPDLAKALETVRKHFHLRKGTQ